MARLPITHTTAVCALGAGRAALAEALHSGRSGLRPTTGPQAQAVLLRRDTPQAQEPVSAQDLVSLPTWLGAAPGLDALDWPQALARFDCRNNRLALRALQSDGFEARVAQAAARWGADRVGVFIGTSTSGILQTELAYRARAGGTGPLPDWFHYAGTHNSHSVADFTRTALGLRGPAFVVSTACSSGAKVFANAARFIALGLIDAAVVGGVDSLCLTTLYGFNSLELLSPDICRPYDAQRQGLSIGEAAAYALLEREGAAPQAWLLGCGESSDGHHMSAPHPEGAGAALAMRAALADAGLAPGDIDYVNLHGTATPSNDAAEDLALGRVFGPGGVACSSTKGATGHTLGAAGALEAVIGVLALEQGLLPGGLNVQQRDPALQARYLTASAPAPLRHVMSNSFGFGGSNACLVLGAA